MIMLVTILNLCHYCHYCIEIVEFELFESQYNWRSICVVWILQMLRCRLVVAFSLLLLFIFKFELSFFFFLKNIWKIEIENITIDNWLNYIQHTTLTLMNTWTLKKRLEWIKNTKFLCVRCSLKTKLILFISNSTFFLVPNFPDLSFI